jgi:conjugative transfer region protein TrbK
MRAPRRLAFALVAAGAIGAVVATAQEKGTTPEAGQTADRLQAELRRCKGLGLAAAEDAACQAANREHRARFLAPSTPYAPRYIDIFPKSRGPLSNERAREAQPVGE